ncbi:MAG: peptidoglycan DD-metalloendopeptidase family protein [Gammaproteobacteria bacterium]|nr:peptidoglycan DD-metalloendopeptidase family protein [Gammaproteobacteria bacterium]
MNGRSMNALRVVGLCATLPLVLAACLAHPPAPVSERSLVDGPMPDVYAVQKYDTLYSVAWRYELDVVDLAARNGIKAPYVIKTGQRIALTGMGPPPPLPKPAVQPAKPPEPATPVATDRPVEPGKAVVTAKAPPVVVPVPVAKPLVVPKPTVTTPEAPRSTPTAPPQSADPVPTAPPAKPAVADPTPASAQPEVPPTVTDGGWRRPVAAKPVRGFGGSSKGLDYSLRTGTTIQAATSGVVVYAGPGLGGFRHLVIVKASERHLVAYGVNVRPNVKEGDTVRRGDAIARAGSGATGGQFHFEVRDRGKPIDPNSLLGS